MKTILFIVAIALILSTHAVAGVQYSTGLSNINNQLASSITLGYRWDEYGISAGYDRMARTSGYHIQAEYWLNIIPDDSDISAINDFLSLRIIGGYRSLNNQGYIGGGIVLFPSSFFSIYAGYNTDSTEAGLIFNY